MGIERFDLRKLDNERLPMTTMNFSLGLRPAFFKLLFSLLLAFMLTACAHTEKYLHPESTFSLDAYDSSEAGSALQTTGLVELPIYETCADKASIHSPVIWVPLIGPAIDISMSSKNIGTTASRIDNALIFIPLLGPTVSFSATSPETCTYKTFKKYDNAPLINGDTKLTNAAVTYITAISDQNCSIFLNRLSSSKEGMDFGKTALTDIGSVIAAGTAFATPVGAAIIGVASLLSNKGAENLAHTYFGGQLIPAIRNNIDTERKNYKEKYITHNESNMTLAQAIQIFNEYDKACSVQTAIDNLNKATVKGGGGGK
jgi:hypothetical protein